MYKSEGRNQQRRRIAGFKHIKTSNEKYKLRTELEELNFLCIYCYILQQLQNELFIQNSYNKQ